MLLVVSSSFPRVSTSVPRGRKHCAVNIVGNLIGIIGRGGTRSFFFAQERRSVWLFVFLVQP